MIIDNFNRHEYIREAEGGVHCYSRESREASEILLGLVHDDTTWDIVYMELHDFLESTWAV